MGTVTVDCGESEFPFAGRAPVATTSIGFATAPVVGDDLTAWTDDTDTDQDQEDRAHGIA